MLVYNKKKESFNCIVFWLFKRYKKIEQQTPVLKKWVDKLIKEGTIKQEWYEVCIHIIE